MMYVRAFTLTVAIAAAFAVPAGAQQGAPFQAQFPGPVIPHWGHVPSWADMQKANAVENPSVRTVAQGIYEQLTAAHLNRSKLTQDVNAAFTDSTESVIAHRLDSAGTPAWNFVKNEQTLAGQVSIYSLQYTAGSMYLTVGVDDNGMVYALGLTSEPPAN
jgi:phage-related protein